MEELSRSLSGLGHLHPLDIGVIAVYLLSMIAVGLYLQRKASAGADAFFLGGNRIPWWALGASGMASNLDVSGTMIIVTLLYALGMQGFFIELRGGIVLVMAFFMVFMGKWNRRSNAMTTAEWMEFRFGTGPAGQAARAIAAVANIVFAVWVVTYFAQGAGIFMGTILGIDPAIGAVIMIVLASIYTIASGLFGVVYTDVLQGFLVLFIIAFVVINVLFSFPLPDVFSVSVPIDAQAGVYQTLEVTKEAWTRLFTGFHLDLPGEYSQYNAFGLLIGFYLFRSFVDGMSAPGGYISQRFYAAKDEREAGLLSLFWILLLAFRWPFVAAIAVMGIYHGVNSEVIANPEEVLPVVLLEYFPIGIKGLLIAGLIAAAMSTFDSVVNAGAAYWVKDLYQRFIRPQATDAQMVGQARLASTILVVMGTLFTFFFTSLNDVWGWLTMGLGVGLIVPQFIRWYWWRFNGWGYAGGTLAGMVVAIGQRLIAPELGELNVFFLTAGITFIVSIAVALATAPVEQSVTEGFFRQTKPFGFWGPARSALSSTERRAIHRENRRDALNMFLAVAWQLSLFLTLMMPVVGRLDITGWLAAATLALSVALYFSWYRHLSPTA